MLQLADVVDAKRLVSRSTYTIGGMLIMVAPWYPEFLVTDFDTRYAIPRYLLTLHFPGPPFHIRGALER